MRISLKKLKITCPLSKYNGKFSISNLKRFEKTTDNTIIINNGFNSVHRTPNAERLYLILISRATNSRNSGWNFTKFCIYWVTLIPPSSMIFLYIFIQEKRRYITYITTICSITPFSIFDKLPIIVFHCLSFSSHTTPSPELNF